MPYFCVECCGLTTEYEETRIVIRSLTSDGEMDVIEVEEVDNERIEVCSDCGDDSRLIEFEIVDKTKVSDIVDELLHNEYSGELKVIFAKYIIDGKIKVRDSDKELFLTSLIKDNVSKEVLDGVKKAFMIEKLTQ